MNILFFPPFYLDIFFELARFQNKLQSYKRIWKKTNVFKIKNHNKATKKLQESELELEPTIQSKTLCAESVSSLESDEVICCCTFLNGGSRGCWRSRKLYSKPLMCALIIATFSTSLPFEGNLVIGEVQWLLVHRQGRQLIGVYSNTGNIFVQLVSQHCCIASWTSCCPYYYRALNLFRNKFRCCKLKKIVAKSSRFYFVQHVAVTCNNEICCETSWARGSNTGNNSFNLQCNNVARQVEKKCCPYYWALKVLKLLETENTFFNH